VLRPYDSFAAMTKAARVPRRELGWRGIRAAWVGNYRWRAEFMVGA
jgi:hypothetical protein